MKYTEEELILWQEEEMNQLWLEYQAEKEFGHNEDYIEHIVNSQINIENETAENLSLTYQL